MEAIFVQWASINRHFVKRMCPLLLFRMMLANFFILDTFLVNVTDYIFYTARTSRISQCVGWDFKLRWFAYVMYSEMVNAVNAKCFKFVITKWWVRFLSGNSGHLSVAVTDWLSHTWDEKQLYQEKNLNFNVGYSIK